MTASGKFVLTRFDRRAAAKFAVPALGGYVRTPDINPLPESMRQKRLFLISSGCAPNSLKRLVPQSLGKTTFDCVTFWPYTEERTLVRRAASGSFGSEQPFAALVPGA